MSRHAEAGEGRLAWLRTTGEASSEGSRPATVTPVGGAGLPAACRGLVAGTSPGAHVEPVEEDAVIIERQLGRPPRGFAGVAWRCPLGRPGVVLTAPQLPDGSPFPTIYYLTCPVAVRLCSTAESTGAMAEFEGRLAGEPGLAAAYHLAHGQYRVAREHLAVALGLDDPVPPSVSAGGMPDRVKCLHALVAHALATGPGVNPVGDEVLSAWGSAWTAGCEGGDS